MELEKLVVGTVYQCTLMGCKVLVISEKAGLYMNNATGRYESCELFNGLLEPVKAV